jgi:hypothetical protein
MILPSRQSGILNFGELFWYRIDYWLSSSTAAKPIALLFATYLLIFVGAILVMLASGSSFTAALWASWTFVADPGKHPLPANVALIKNRDPR